MIKAIFLDRDGVLLKEPVFDPAIGSASEAINSWDRFEILPTVGPAFKKIKGRGYKIFMVTNQEALEEGGLSQEFYDETNDKIIQFINSEDGAPIDRILTCPHPTDQGCPCRKPKRGLIDELLKEYPEIDFSKSWFVGDRATDVRLGKTIGARTIFLPMNHVLSDDVTPDATMQNLEDAIDFILSEES